MYVCVHLNLSMFFTVLFFHFSMFLVFHVSVLHLYTVLIISTSLDVTEIIFAVLYVSIMVLTRCYKTTVFFNIYINAKQKHEILKTY